LIEGNVHALFTGMCVLGAIDWGLYRMSLVFVSS
jgi:hypothetical protein